MKIHLKHFGTFAMICGLILPLSSLAGKPDWDDEGKGRGKSSAKENRKENKGRDDDDDRRSDRNDRYGDRAIVGFNRDDQRIIRDYYAGEMQRGNCPPGLAKKGNGCQPPGQAKRQWQRGQVLPRDVRYNDIPRQLYGRLPPLPDGYRYGQVGSDVVLMAAGTNLVVDILEDVLR